MENISLFTNLTAVNFRELFQMLFESSNIDSIVICTSKPNHLDRKLNENRTNIVVIHITQSIWMWQFEWGFSSRNVKHATICGHLQVHRSWRWEWKWPKWWIYEFFTFFPSVSYLFFHIREMREIFSSAGNWLRLWCPVCQASKINYFHSSFFVHLRRCFVLSVHRFELNNSIELTFMLFFLCGVEMSKGRRKFLQDGIKIILSFHITSEHLSSRFSQKIMGIVEHPKWTLPYTIVVDVMCFSALVFLLFVSSIVWV